MGDWRDELAGLAGRLPGRLGTLRVDADRVIGRLRAKNLHLWVPAWTKHIAERARTRLPKGRKHLFFAFCDHWEPLWARGGAKAPDDVGERRVRAWVDQYPFLASRFRDADGRGPRHSFFFPAEEYRPSFLDGLARLARQGHGEVELHLHHDRDTPENLRRTVAEALDAFAQHGHVSRRKTDGRYQYAFIHGNWCLANARADGRWCGIDDELPLLWETGCYADFTFPAAPDESQPSLVNQIYWPTGDLARRRAYEAGERARVGACREDRMLIVQGPLALARRPGRLSVRVENAAVTADDPGTNDRIATWVSQHVHVAGRPDWVFVKVHTHGAPEAQAASLLGEGGERLHEALTSRWNDGHEWVLHYVTAREMYNLARAAMDGARGEPRELMDYVVPPPPVAAA